MIRFNRFFLLIVSLVFVISCSTETSDNPTDKRAPNLKVTGSSGSDLLSDMEYTSMNIEVVYAEGFRPTDEAINQFRSFLEARTFKPDGIKINLRSTESSNRSPFDEEDIKAVENETRTLYNVGDEIAVWIYFADGEKDEEKENTITLGSAFRNTSIIVYGKTIRDFSNRSGAPDRAVIEAATLNHEFGHLFGLVNLGTPPVTDHEDQENKGHCAVEGCLMRASIEFGNGVLDVIEGSEIPGLEDACIGDLQSIGGK
ncbi:hypothetical protein ML462_09695 [Gramella lutea]|uniref:Membrane metalloprotease n=1 Tax=Christiangramia lutea TaxID=1607951 RepID=A0A9X1V3Y3_9FLAO|nr:hypothetical protein [Christiangramia lutea]MCH4823445.1 hypothetical protein [Christiangramia lutea]